MSGSLIKIDEEIISSPDSSVTLTGIDTTYDVYKLVINNVHPGIDNANLSIRLTESGSPNETSNYDNAAKFFRSGSSSYGNFGTTNQTSFGFGSYIGSDTGEGLSGVHYIFSANLSGEYTFITSERMQVAGSGELSGEQAGGIFTSASSVDGVHIFISSGNMETGSFTLYGLKK